MAHVTNSSRVVIRRSVLAPPTHDARSTDSVKRIELAPVAVDPARVVRPVVYDASAQPDVQIYTLGHFAIDVHTMHQRHIPRPLEGQASLLLKILLSSPGYRCEREQLIDMLWPERNIAQGQDSLRHVLAQLRRALEPAPFASRRSQAVALDRHTVWLHGNATDGQSSSTVSVDARQFEVLATRALKALVLEPRTAQDIDAALTLGHHALALYQGTYLPTDIYADWTRSTRTRLSRLWVALLRHLAETAIKRQQFEQAILLLGQLVDAIPDDEDAASRLMLVQGAIGQRGEAHRTYMRLCQHLTAILGMPPAREVQVLAHTIFSSESQHELLKLLA